MELVGGGRWGVLCVENAEGAVMQPQVERWWGSGDGKGREELQMGC